MANEIQASFSLVVANGSFRDQFTPPPQVITQNSIGLGGGIQEIGDTSEVLDIGSVATNGRCILQNLDATNTVLYGPQSGNSMIVWGSLPPGEWEWFRLAPTVVMRAQADTNTTAKLLVKLYND